MKQMQLEKLAINQLVELGKKAKVQGFDSAIDVMSMEELELYKGNCNEYIGNAQEVLSKSKNKEIRKSQEFVVRKYEDELKAIEVKLKILKAEHDINEIETGSIEVELIDGEIILLGVQELADFLGWDKRKVSLYNKRGKFEKAKGKAGKRPLWLLSQAKRIKELYA